MSSIPGPAAAKTLGTVKLESEAPGIEPTMSVSNGICFAKFMKKIVVLLIFYVYFCKKDYHFFPALFLIRLHKSKLTFLLSTIFSVFF